MASMANMRDGNTLAVIREPGGLSSRSKHKHYGHFQSVGFVEIPKAKSKSTFERKNKERSGKGILPFPATIHALSEDHSS